ncbi:magnesium-transporting ATPase [Actinorhabdospora filicis]|uniref:Magnesium-transporting ATPase n=1 Tax=Actinorhabdospora filicis TaxID=1785913 RepID=A0A9W6W882_9ACTN|nr:HAD-IC family P-type ATPase [Actinorhabdospora filicis]GLZ76206.1 magnesium-transporting ATPase [Actinorhabdospora filicis]
MSVPSGLTATEVAERVADGRVNAAPPKQTASPWQILARNLFTFFNGLIGVLTVVALVFGGPKQALFGLVIVFNSAIGTIQELRAKAALDKLAIVGQAPSRVRRDGADAEVAPEELVADDLVLIGPGEQIPVDGRVATATGLEVDESLLTGESDPVVKNPGDEVLSGSFIAAGSGSFTVTRVGADAYASRLLAEASRFSLADSQLMGGINRFLKIITILIVPTAALLIFSQSRSGQSLRDSIVGTVAGIVPMIPEGLVLLTSIAFVVGVLRLARRQCLVQELPAIEGLARVDVLCLDKTGTLTEPGMVLKEVIGIGDGDPEAVLAALVKADDTPNPTMQAVAAAVPAAPAWAVREVAPFSSARKWSGADFGEHGAYIFGAPDVVLTGESLARAQELGADGERVLALVAVPSLAGGLEGARPLALVVLEQRLRQNVHETLGFFAEQGVTLKIISGDNAVSVGAVAAAAGVPDAHKVIDARELPDDVEALAGALETYTVFGRVTPQQKRSFVTALHTRGHTVAMTGDGVNDVLALKEADLGVAMGSGSAAARGVAKVVLLNNDFSSLPRVVAEGRRVLGNIERVSDLFLTKTIYSIGLALVVGLTAIPYPFAPIHVTLIGALTIGIPSFFLALAPNGERFRPGFVSRVLRFAIPAGVLVSGATLLAYWLARDNGESSLREDKATATITLFCVSLAVLAFTARPFTWWRGGLVLVMGGAFLLVLAVPFARDFFELGYGNAYNTSVGLGIAAVAIVLLGLVTWFGKRRAAGTRPPAASAT